MSEAGPQRSEAKSVDDVLITQQLALRPSRAPDHTAENRALVALAEELATNPGGVLQKCAELTIELCRADSAGVSVLEPGGASGIFRWHATAGAFAANLSGTMPREASPCGIVIARNGVLLFNDAERFFPALRGVEPRIYENLLAPWHAEGEAIGTLGAIKHSPEGHFDSEDARLLASLARFASAAHQITATVAEARAGREELRESEARLRVIVENARDYAIFTADSEDRLEAWWPGAEAVFGWAASEVVGQPASILFTPEDRNTGEDENEVETARREGVAPNRRWHLRKDGTRVFIDGNVTALRDENGKLRGFLKIGQDVTERRRVEEALRESEARFRHMADSAPALIWMTDADGKLTFANMHHDHIFGRPAAEMLGDGWTSIILEEDRERFRVAFLDAFQAGRPFAAEVRVRDKAGQVCWLHCEGVPRLDDAGRFLGYTGCNLDITETRLAAEELERRIAERTAELMAAGETIRQTQKMEAVGQLTGGIAHDFNNMLQGIVGALEIARRRIAESRVQEARRYLDVAREAAERAAGLTRRLLAFARQQRLDPQPVDADRLIAGLADLIRRTVGPEIAVDLRLRDGAGGVLCDTSELESVLLNLCINARDAMPEGGRLAIGTADARLSAEDIPDNEAPPGPYVVISVADTGTGMPPEVLQRAFEPFFTTKPQGQGTGLGLSQVYGFVKQSGGFVRIASAPSQGTTVRLFMPLHEQSETREEHRTAPTVPTGPGGVSATVLLVDDEELVRGPAAERLRELGYRVLEAAEGPAALRLLDGGARIDLLVTDVGLPGGMNGRQVAEAARERVPGVPVLFITGYAGTALPPGTEVVGKPFQLDDLAQRVQALLAGGRRTS